MRSPTSVSLYLTVILFLSLPMLSLGKLSPLSHRGVAGGLSTIETIERIGECREFWGKPGDIREHLKGSTLINFSTKPAPGPTIVYFLFKTKRGFECFRLQRNSINSNTLQFYSRSESRATAEADCKKEDKTPIEQVIKWIFAN